MFALLQIKKYDDFVKKFYLDNITLSGKINNFNNHNNIFRENELDSVLPAYSLLYIKDYDNKYSTFVKKVFDNLQKLPTLNNCGNNFSHKVDNPNWNKYPFALDGLYMALPFYLDYSKNYDEVFYRLNWVANNRYILIIFSL